MGQDPALTVDGFLAARPGSRPLYDAVRAALSDVDGLSVRVSKSQIGFRRRTEFAAVWCPGDYLRADALAPLVLTLFLHERVESPRWKQIAEPAPGRFTHHLELRRPEEVDDEVRGWLRAAWSQAS